MSATLLVCLLISVVASGDPRASSAGPAGAPPARARARARANRSLRSPLKRIVNGVDATVDSYPFFSSLFWSSDDRWAGCGGALVGPRHVLSAAHCFEKSRAPFRYAWKVGAYENRNHPNENGGQGSDYVHVDRVDVFPGYESAVLGKDLAVLRLNRTTEVPYISVDDGTIDSFMRSGDLVRVVGFGQTTNNKASHANKLQKAELAYLANEDCLDEFYFDGFADVTITDDMMCVAPDAESAGTDTCSGDSGGPAFVERGGGGSPTLVGVVSWGYSLCGTGVPAVNARVGSPEQYLWIENIVCGGENDGDKPDWCPGMDASASTTTDTTPSEVIPNPTEATVTSSETLVETTSTSTTTAAAEAAPQRSDPGSPTQAECDAEKTLRWPLQGELRKCNKLTKYEDVIRTRICAVIQEASETCPLRCAGECF